MATSVTSYVETMDGINSPSPTVYTSSNTYQDMLMLREPYDSSKSVNGVFVYSYSYPNMNDSQKYTITYGTIGQMFNQPVKMAENETNACGMFGYYPGSTYATNINAANVGRGYGNFTVNINSLPPIVMFNSKVYMSNNVTNCFQMFAGCIFYDQQITIPNNVTNTAFMFNNCISFNKPVVIPDSVTNCRYMFWDCKSFNSEVKLSNNANDLTYMFSRCMSLNRPITIPNGVKNCYEMFSGYNYQPQVWMNYGPNDIYIPSSVQCCANMFRVSSTRPGNIYINGGGANLTNALGMLEMTGTGKRVNVYCSNIAKIQGLGITNTSVTWTGTLNGVYNASLNIYILQNYTG